MLQVIETTDKQKTKMYMKCTKKELIKMLIQANKVLDRFYNNNPAGKLFSSVVTDGYKLKY